MAMSGAGVLACAEAKSGQSAWQLRLQVPLGEKTSRGVFTSTPVAAGGCEPCQGVSRTYVT